MTTPRSVNKAWYSGYHIGFKLRSPPLALLESGSCLSGKEDAGGLCVQHPYPIENLANLVFRLTFMLNIKSIQKLFSKLVWNNELRLRAF